MRHVHDGELHAFLDGALGLLPEGRGEEVREHLSNCPACRERLQDEEAVRSKAQILLGDPDLSGVSLSTFEELRERAEALGSTPPVPHEVDKETKARYRGPLRGLPLAWAATLVLAMGVGWMGGQVWRGLPSESQGAAFAPGESYPTRLTEPEIGSVPETLTDDAEEEMGAPSLGAAVLDVVSDETTGEVTAFDTASLGSQALQLQELVVSASRGAASTLQTQANSTPEMALVLEQADISVARVESMARSEAEDLPPDEASLEYTYAIPGLEVVSIEWEERVPGVRALLIRQLMAPGDTLELRYLGMLLGAEPEARRDVSLSKEGLAVGRVYANVLAASLPPGWQQVVMERGRLLLVARGPLSDGKLKGLLKTLR